MTNGSSKDVSIRVFPGVSGTFGYFQAFLKSPHFFQTYFLG